MFFKQGVSGGHVVSLTLTKSQMKAVKAKMGIEGLEGLSADEKAKRLLNASELEVALAEVLEMDIEKLREMNYELEVLD